MKKEMRNKRFLLLQVNDALFPIGAYSHSYGLETYIQKDLVRNAEEAWDYIRKRLCYGFCCNEFLAAKLAYDYASGGEPERLDLLEDILQASRTPREIREAGKKLGSRFIKTIRELPISWESSVFECYLKLRRGKITSHSVVYGTFCAAVGIPYEEAMENYLYAQTSSMVTNCVKTIPLSQTAGQQLLCRSHGLFHEILEKLETLTEDDLCLSTPGFDIRSMQHEGLYSRIYMS